jgi:hypothetical protein
MEKEWQRLREPTAKEKEWQRSGGPTAKEKETGEGCNPRPERQRNCRTDCKGK